MKIFAKLLVGTALLAMPAMAADDPKVSAEIMALARSHFTGADLQYSDFPPEKWRELVHRPKMLRAEDTAAAVHHLLTEPRRTMASHTRVEAALQHR